MSKTFNLNSKSDMKKFEKSLEKTIMNKAHSAILSREYDVTCPHCKNEVKVPTGRSSCPMCSKNIDLNLDINIT